MAVDPLDQVLRLVADGRLSAEDAAPILAALDERPGPAAEAARSGDGPHGRPSDGIASEGAPAFTPSSSAAAGPSSLRLEVRDGGRQVVNLRLPIAIGRLAIDRVPGLSGDQADRVREALRTGMRGPILLVEDGDSLVRIVLE